MQSFISWQRAGNTAAILLGLLCGCSHFAPPRKGPAARQTGQVDVYHGISDDGNFMAYGVSASGSDRQEWKVRDVRTARDTGDHLEWIKFSSASWTQDGQGFYYSRYDAPAAGAKLTKVNYFQKLYYHRVGTPQSEDRLKSANVVNDTFVCTYLKDAQSRVQVFALDGKPIRDVVLPGIGSVGGFGGKRKDAETADKWAFLVKTLGMKGSYRTQ